MHYSKDPVPFAPKLKFKVPETQREDAMSAQIAKELKSGQVPKLRDSESSCPLTIQTLIHPRSFKAPYFLEKKDKCQINRRTSSAKSKLDQTKSKSNQT